MKDRENNRSGITLVFKDFITFLSVTEKVTMRC